MCSAVFIPAQIPGKGRSLAPIGGNLIDEFLKRFHLPSCHPHARAVPRHRMAVARPMPLLAPVIRAIFPFTMIASICCQEHRFYLSSGQLHLEPFGNVDWRTNKKPRAEYPGLFKFNPATTYSPTSLPMQYHRRWRA